MAKIEGLARLSSPNSIPYPLLILSLLQAMTSERNSQGQAHISLMRFLNDSGLRSVIDIYHGVNCYKMWKFH
jgi:hypothetical protein